MYYSKTDSISLKLKPLLAKKIFCFWSSFKSLLGPLGNFFLKDFLAKLTQSSNLWISLKISDSLTPLFWSSTVILIGPKPFLLLAWTYSSANRESLRRLFSSNLSSVKLIFSFESKRLVNFKYSSFRECSLLDKRSSALWYISASARKY